MGLATTMRGLLASAVLALLSTLIATAAAAAAPVGTVTEFSNGIPVSAEPTGITAGPDGNVWFTENGSATTPGAIARITPAGVVTQFGGGLPEFSGPEGITAGPDGDLWFTDALGRIDRITTSGTITEFSAGITHFSDPDTITVGPDGNLWFTEFEGRIGRITPAGVATEFPLPPGWKEEQPYGIATGPQGNLWFAETGHFSTKQEGGGIGRITPTGSITEFSNGIPSGSRPNGMAQGPDGNMWFSLAGTSEVGRITPAGVITTFKTGITPGSEPSGMAAGPDGNMWFAEYAGRRIGRISTTGAVTEFSAGVSSSSPLSIAAGPDGNLWFAQLGGGSAIPAEVGSIVSGAAPPLLSAPTVSGGAVAGAPQQCAAAQWSTWAGLQPATSLFAIDGYRFMLDGAQVSVGQSYTPPASSIGHSLTCSETVTYALQNVTASATSTAVTVVAPPAPAVTGSTPSGSRPVLSAVRESASKWREGGKLAQISRQKKKPPVGTTFSFALNEHATVSFAFTQQVGGRKVGAKCLARTPKNAKHKRCTRTVTAGALSFGGHAGTNKVTFQGRISPSKHLAPGHYTLIITATNAAGARSAPASLGFTIVR